MRIGSCHAFFRESLVLVRIRIKSEINRFYESWLYSVLQQVFKIGLTTSYRGHRILITQTEQCSACVPAINIRTTFLPK